MSTPTAATVSTATVEQLARQNAGAIEVEQHGRSNIAVLIGPISFWWEDGQWDTPEHKAYLQWRDAVEVTLKKAGWLVYKPHDAFGGAWDDRAQVVNDAGIWIADTVFDLTPPGIPVKGTIKEREVAREAHVLIQPCPPNDPGMLKLMERTERAYAAQHGVSA